MVHTLFLAQIVQIAVLPEEQLRYFWHFDFIQDMQSRVLAARIPSPPVQVSNVFLMLQREQIHVILLTFVAPVLELIRQHSQHEDAATDLQKKSGEHVIQL